VHACDVIARTVGHDGVPYRIALAADEVDTYPVRVPLRLVDVEDSHVLDRHLGAVQREDPYVPIASDAEVPDADVLPISEVDGFVRAAFAIEHRHGRGVEIISGLIVWKWPVAGLLRVALERNRATLGAGVLDQHFLLAVAASLDKHRVPGASA